VIYFIASVAETNRAPFDLPEAESELVAGFHTEYSGFRWAIYMLAEYANMFVVSAVAVTLFLGGWMRPFPNVAWLEPINYIAPLVLIAGTGAGCLYLVRKLVDMSQRLVLTTVSVLLLVIGLLFLIPVVNGAVIGLFWFFLKVFVIIYCLIWFRGTFPRLRYDQLMGLGWKFLIEIAFLWVMISGVVVIAKEEGWNMFVVVPSAVVGALVVGAVLALNMTRLDSVIALGTSALVALYLWRAWVARGRPGGVTGALE
jgi:NADH-quinone oxidoreductase subunit H